MARRICRTSKGRFKKCGGGGGKSKKGSSCAHGKVKSGPRKGRCRKVARRRE